jgi:hypothetical protein
MRPLWRAFIEEALRTVLHVLLVALFFACAGDAGILLLSYLQGVH